MKDRGNESFVSSYKDVYKCLESWGSKPTLNVMDNEISKALQNYVSSQDVNWKLVETDNHQVNAAERAIQTFKNNFISGLCTIDPIYHLQLWWYLLVHVEMNLNMLQKSRADPTKYAYEFLEGVFDYNAAPLDPPGCK